ncbi:MAG: ABC transporter ATP-binding protein [Smithellaceae bacterium]
MDSLILRTIYKNFFTGREKRQFVFLASGLMLNGLLEVISIALIMPFLAVAASPELIQKNLYLRLVYETLKLENSRDFLLFLGFTLVFALLLVNISNAIFTWFTLRFTWAINHSLSVRLMEHYMSMDYLAFIQRNSAELQRNIQIETMEVVNNLISPILNLLNKGISLLMTIIFLLWIDPFLAVSVGVIFSVIYFAIYYVSKKTLYVIGQSSLQDNEAKFRALSEALGVFKIAKLLHLEAFFLTRFSNASYRFSRNQSKRMTISQLPRFAVEMVAFTALVGICLFIIGTKPNFSEAIPILGLYTFAAYRFMPGMQQVYSSFSVLRSWLPHINYLVKEFEFDSMPDDAHAREKTKNDSRNETLAPPPIIQLQNVIFSYPNSKRTIINNISLSVPYKCTVGFFGETGSGKTTTIDLIMGIIPPDSGSILVHNQPLSSENMASWQKSIGYVPQDIYLIDSSIIENIAFGIPKEKIDIEQVRNVCILANIAVFIEEELIDGYETVVGERGVRLSGGQRQRIGIARALYHNPDILIFDEATSALDNETEKVLMEAIDNFSHNKTIILIAHRLSTLEKCDSVFKFGKGRIIKSGKFDAVVKHAQR